ncbi:CRISPR-associated helicase/endonuclease Cas3 [Kosmotoga olearia]|uniref:CRISPR-associated helicase Cas3 n=1 Tax=Kosmotoga olearia (strain ATCC BAA-1733 / DSM 21960 / TBF 19.5.1) TaxID=521045 RepID=C5CFB0_KOSOT|nr:CRISPR-associated helicase/endonuclease Cas3 [Kosmotoga olearia]ACR79387.1 CRISPR-associated helicase Cas3 [Kosmotoga olearia TBF 19.5.1]
MSEVYSHPPMGNEPGRLLIDHLKGVYYLMMSEIETAKKYMDFERFLGVEYSTLKLLVEAIAYLHDLGKATPEFQKKIRKLKYDKEKSLHAVLGAFAVGKYLKANLPEEKHYLIPLIVTLVRRHHGKAEYPEFGCDLNDEVDLLEWQVANLDSKFLNELAYKIQIPKLDPLELEDNVDEWQDEFQDHFYEVNDIQSFILYMYLSSLLDWADKTDAAFRDRPLPKRDPIPKDLVEEYRKVLGFDNPGRDPMNQLRNKFYHEATNDTDFSIGILKGRTGIGKTLTLFSLGLKLREKLTNSDYVPRIIYCLPFLSIIDQTYEVAVELFEKTGRSFPTENQVLQQHHLSDIEYSTKEGEGYEKYLADLLINSWNSEIIITTFVSFFHSIFTNKRNMKFFRIPGSIVLLDEIQAIPPKYWELTGKILKLLADYGGTKFVFSTATMPKCFGISGKHLYTGEIPLDRFDLHYIGEVTFEKFKEIFLREVVEKARDESKGLMVVLNTIGCAKAVLEEISEFVDKKYLYYLSSEVPPIVRKNRIEKLKNLKGFRVLVTTQLVEAGVDLDFDYCIRDIGPLDSVVQVAGRVNRSNRKKKGQVILVDIKEFMGKRDPSKIYDSVLLFASRKVLSNNDNYSESMLYNLVEIYLAEIETKGFEEESRMILKNIYKLEFSKINEFKLIEERPTNPVFIELDENAKNAWKNYQEILSKDISTQDKFELLAEKKDAIRKLAPYIVNYRLKWNESENALPPVVNGFHYVSNDERELQRYYDSVTGFHSAGSDIY